jgi:tetratricopeptide (TPR) repeat protein
MKPKELLFSHSYSKAVEAYKAHLLQHPEQNFYPGLGQGYLSLCNFSEALSAFKKADEIGSKTLKGSSPYINQAGTTLWLKGEKSQAMKEWHSAVSGILDGTIHYGDLAGGATQGLLLWYGAITLNDANHRDYAIGYLRHIKERRVYGTSVVWPRPLAIMVLGEESVENVLLAGAGSPILFECIRIAKKDLLKRRHLCQILFYSACLERERGNEAACTEKMQMCFQLEKPSIECEWYLARGECEKIE